MRFKDFEIVIHGDFSSGDDELDLRSAIAQQLGTLKSKSSDPEAETLEKINSGDAKWAPPLQQHLDVIKQSVSDNAPVELSEDLMSSSLSSVLHQELNFCKNCGKLCWGPRLLESVNIATRNKISQVWNKVLNHYGVPGKKCNCNRIA